MKERSKRQDGEKDLKGVTTRDYNAAMKAKTSPEVRGTTDWAGQPAVVQEIASLPGVGSAISVRSAKAHLSGLLEEVAAGREIVITSDGKPKARLVPMDASAQRRPFQGTREHLKAMPKWAGGPTAEELVREDRDSRGW